MIRFSKIFFYITVAVLLVWQLPWCYAFLTLKPVKTPFTMYSSVLGDFVITQLDENKQLHRYDTKGNTYTQQQVDSLLPSLYVRQLTADERFPDTICGKAVSPKDIQLTNFTFKSVPSAINAPQTGLYFLMESMSKRVDLKMPEDAFRLVLRNKLTPLQIVITNGYTCSIFQVAKITKRECSYAPFFV